jgi:hypothetical protein
MAESSSSEEVNLRADEIARVENYDEVNNTMDGINLADIAAEEEEEQESQEDHADVDDGDDDDDDTDSESDVDTIRHGFRE